MLEPEFFKVYIQLEPGRYGSGSVLVEPPWFVEAKACNTCHVYA